MLNKIKFTLIIFVCIVSVLLFNDTYRILATQVYNENFSILDDRYFSENNVDIRNIDKNNPIGIASIFHIFSKDTYISADCNGNIASENCDILEYGTRTNNFNLTSGADVFYIKNVKEVRNSTSFRGAKNHVIFGSKVQGDFSDKGLQINNQNVNSKNIQSLVFNNDKYIDFDNEFMKLANKSEQYYSHLEDSNDFKKSFSDMNRRTIEFENTDSTKTKYLNVPYEYISCPQDIFLKNISQNANVIINVTDIPNSSELSINTKTQLNYRGSYGNLNSSENHSLPNKILWNFGNYSGSIHFSSGFFMGSILAPNAKINSSVNIDGNLVAKEVKISGETHRWDISTPEQPSKPDTPEQPSKPDTPEQPSKPDTPEQPSKPDTPEQPSKPDTPEQPSKPDTPEQPNKPDTPEQPSKPDTPEQPSKPDTPEQPSKPDTPEQPSKPDTPEQPNKPDTPEQPNKPDTPEQPNKPDTPEQPSKPDTPEQPSNNGKYNNKEENKKLNFDNNHSQTNAKVVIRKHSNNPYGNLQNHNHSSKLPQTGENIIISLLISFFGITILTILIFRKISLNKKKR